MKRVEKNEVKNYLYIKNENKSKINDHVLFLIIFLSWWCDDEGDGNSWYICTLIKRKRQKKYSIPFV